MTENNASCEKQPETFEESVDCALAEIRRTLLKKHHDYGSRNILEFKDVGVIIRLNDKLSRMKNLYGITDNSYQRKDSVNESIEDTWKDVAGYGLIGWMLYKKIFDRPTLEEKKEK